jgi:hypothetical protein
VLLGKPAAPLIVFELAKKGVPALRAKPRGLTRDEVGQGSISEGLSRKERAPILAKTLTCISSAEPGCANLIGAVLAITHDLSLLKKHPTLEGCKEG